MTRALVDHGPLPCRSPVWKKADILTAENTVGRVDDLARPNML
ncbi:MAG: hypothetical protein AB7E60_07460 [Sphingobium sp.]